MTTIANGAVTLDVDELAWFAENYGDTPWCVYVAGMDEITTHDRQGPDNGEDPAVDDVGDPFTEEMVRTYLTDFDSGFGPNSPLAVELQNPSYAIALHYGVPAFGSHGHGHSVLPPDGTWEKPGDCACGRTWAEAEKQQADELAKVEWAVHVAGLGTLIRQDMELEDDDPENLPWTEESARRFVEFANGKMQQIHRTEPNQAVLLHYGQPVIETAPAAWFFASIDESADSTRRFTTLEAAKHAAIIDWESGDTGPGIPPPDYTWITDETQPDHHVLLDDGVVTGWWVQPDMDIEAWIRDQVSGR